MLLVVTEMFRGELKVPSLPVAYAIADREIVPRFEGILLQVATILGAVPEVANLMQPGILFPFAKNVIFETTSTLAIKFMRFR